MSYFDRVARGISVVLAASMALLYQSTAGHAGTGSVRIHIAKAGFIVGVGGGRGTLHYNGKSYPLRVGGVSVGTIGVASADLVGRAYHLRHARDVIGTYSAASGSIAVAGGVKSARLHNSNGVILDLHGTQAGFEASLSLSGMSISMH